MGADLPMTRMFQMYCSNQCGHLEVLLPLLALADLAGRKPHVAKQSSVTTDAFNFHSAETH
jgi:hypothetical protein